MQAYAPVIICHLSSEATSQYLQPEVRADLAQILAQYAVPPPVPR